MTGIALSAVADVLQPQVAELALHHVDRADQQRDAEDGRQMPQQARMICDLAFAAMVQAASAWRASAEWISAIVSGTPYSATKPPKRGPSCWPSST